MTTADTLDRGRESFERRAWADAFEELAAADRETSLAPEDLERLAMAAYLVGRDADRDEVLSRAHQGWLRLGDAARAVRCAFWLAFGLLNRGELARGGGWYLAHLLLFIGLALFVPGLLALTDLAAARRPRAGYAARLLALTGVAGVAAVFVGEMLAGRLGAGSAAAAENLLDTMFSGPIAAPVIPVLLCFFAGAVVFALPLTGDSGPLRWPAAVFLAGIVLVVAEVVSSQVVLSQIGNFLIWGGSVAFAWLLVRGEVGAPAGASTSKALPAG
jgi:hypothetical protein